MTKASALADAILRDRERRKQTQARPTRTRERDDFDPFSVERWRVVAGHDAGFRVKGPGYFPKPMRMGPVGWHIECQHCLREFESKGWAYCPTCMDVPAEERRARRKAVERSAVRTPTAHGEQLSISPAPSLQPDGTEIIEEFPPLFGFADWPTNLAAGYRHGRALPHDLAEAILRTEADHRLRH